MTAFRFILAVLGVLVVMPAPASALPVTTAAGNPTIVVAVIATLSGANAAVGQDSLDGFTTALRQLGGRFANQEVRVIAVDDRGSPDAALAATRKLLERERPDFIVTAVSAPAMAAIIRPLLDARLFVINLDAMPTGLRGAGCSPALFDMAPSPETTLNAIAAFLAGERMKRLVIVGPDTEATGQAAAGIRHGWNGEVAAVIKVRPGALAFQKELKRIHDLGPDAVFSLLSGGVGAAFVRDYSAHGLKGEAVLLTGWQGLERTWLPGMGDHALDVLSPAVWQPDQDTPLNKKMVADFELEYGRPATTWVAQGYDAALLLEAAMKLTSGRTTDREAVRHALRKAEFQSVRGPFRFEPNHGPSLNVYLRKVIRDAKGRLTFETRGTLIKDWHGTEGAQCPMRWADDAATAAKPAGAGASPARKPASGH